MLSRPPFLVLLTTLIALPVLGLWAQTKIDPKSPDLKTLPELGQMLRRADGVSFGRMIHPLGDVNHDGLNDWCVSQNREFKEVDLLVYHGVRGGLPSSEDADRIGPTELASSTQFIATGDWDADGNRDIAVRISLVGDTTAGGIHYDISRLVIFWGTTSGYSLYDTTQLENNAPMWLGPGFGESVDFDGDGIEDLLTVGNNGLNSGQVVKRPYIMMFRGYQGRQWGRTGVPRTADWEWWNPPSFKRFSVMDHDCDHAPDLVLYWDDEDVYTTGHLSILYGNPTGGFPDTTSVLSLDLAPVNGHNALLSDVTGDGLAELLVVTMDETVRVYAGHPGVRLDEQFGSGDDPPDAQSSRWYRRPWALLPLPHKLDDAFRLSGETPLFDFGDVGLNGTNDIWVYSYPFIVAYSTGRSGECLDSLFDAVAYPIGTDLRSAVVLGDIDGSGIPAIALGYEAREAIQFIKPSSEVLENRCYLRKALHEPGLQCSSTSGVDLAGVRSHNLTLRAEPNPSASTMRVEWKGRSSGNAEGRLCIHDMQGHQLLCTAVEATDYEYMWKTDGIASGRYVVSLTIGKQTATLQVILTH